MEEPIRSDQKLYRKGLGSDEQIRGRQKEYQRNVRQGKRMYFILRWFPAVWCFESRFFRLFPPFLITPRFERDRIRWLDRASWQSLLRVTAGKFKWLKWVLSLAPPAILACSSLLEVAARHGVTFHMPRSIILNIILYLLLHLSLRACPKAIRANIAARSTWQPVSKIDLVKGFLADTLLKEIVTIRLTARDLPHLHHALEERALADHFATTGKPWPYEGLDQIAMKLVRELGAAVAKARCGIAYERRVVPYTLGKWELSKRVAERGLYLHGRGGPHLYSAQIDPLGVELEIQDFKKDTDISIEFSQLGRNFYRVNPDHRVDYFVQCYDLFVDERTADTVLEIVSRNESCKRPVFRVAAWFLLFLIFVISVYQLWQAALRISALLT